jgi:hypothetical protein
MSSGSTPSRGPTESSRARFRLRGTEHTVRARHVRVPPPNHRVIVRARRRRPAVDHSGSSQNICHPCHLEYLAGHIACFLAR